MGLDVARFVRERLAVHHGQTHFFAVVDVVGGTTATIIRDGQTVADTEAYQFAVGLTLTGGGIGVGDRVILIDPIGDGTGLTIIAEMP